MRLSDALHARFGTGQGIALQHLAEFLFRHLTTGTGAGHDASDAARALWRDYQRGGRLAARAMRRNATPAQLAAGRAGRR